MSGHYKTLCKECGGVIDQCRCLGPHEIRYSVCSECQKGLSTKESLAYFQGTKEPKDDKRKPDKTSVPREELDTRHPHTYTWYTNHDYTSDPNPNETGIGGGLYHGPMDRFTSVKQFLDNRRKKMKERRNKAEKSARRALALIKLAREVTR